MADISLTEASKYSGLSSPYVTEGGKFVSLKSAWVTEGGVFQKLFDNITSLNGLITPPQYSSASSSYEYGSGPKILSGREGFTPPTLLKNISEWVVLSVSPNGKYMVGITAKKINPDAEVWVYDKEANLIKTFSDSNTYEFVNAIRKQSQTIVNDDGSFWMIVGTNYSDVYLNKYDKDGTRLKHLQIPFATDIGTFIDLIFKVSASDDEKVVSYCIYTHASGGNKAYGGIFFNDVNKVSITFSNYNVGGASVSPKGRTVYVGNANEGFFYHVNLSNGTCSLLSSGNISNKYINGIVWDEDDANDATLARYIEVSRYSGTSDLAITTKKYNTNSVSALGVTSLASLGYCSGDTYATSYCGEILDSGNLYAYLIQYYKSPSPYYRSSLLKLTLDSSGVPTLVDSALMSAISGSSISYSFSLHNVTPRVLDKNLVRRAR